MMTLLYNIAFLTFGIVYLPVFAVKALRAEHPGELLRQRLGFFSRALQDKFLGKKIIWVHAVSVGEVLACEKFLRECQQRFSDHHFVLTTVTPTGRKVAGKLEGRGLTVCYFPFDLTFSVRSFFKTLGPECLILVETEIWPNLLVEARRAHVPVVIMNARLSAKSFPRYRRARFFLRDLFRKLDFVLAQTPEDAARFAALGVAEERLAVAGNMKFDNIVLEDADPALFGRALRREWGFSPEDLIWVAGSTHPGEEKKVVETALDLKNEFPGLKLVLAPRHIERSNGLSRWLRRCGLRVRLATHPDPDAAGPAEVLLVDCLGVLKNLYAMADVVFVGGSFVKRGGQNPIEPAGFRRAIIHGPHVFNFHNVYGRLNAEGAAVRVRDKAQLEFAVRRLLNNPSERAELGDHAFQTVKSLQGATARYLDWLAGFLKTRSQPERTLHANVI